MVELITSSVRDTGKIPSQRAIQRHAGGSMREVVKQHQAAVRWQAALAKLALTIKADSSLDHPPNAAEMPVTETLQAELNRLREERELERVEWNGLRKHLLLETARLRDELANSATLPKVIITRHLSSEIDPDDILEPQ